MDGHPEMEPDLQQELTRARAEIDSLRRQLDEREPKNGLETYLRRARDQLEQVLDSAGLGVWEHRFGTDVVKRDYRWARMLGYERGEFSDSLDAWHTIIHPDDRARTEEAAIRHEAGLTPCFRVEHRLRTKSGKWKWILNWGRVTERDEKGKPIRAVGTHLDISEQKLAEEQRRRLEEKLREAQRVESLAVLAGGVAHDFNNLLQGILGHTSLVLLDLPPQSPLRKRICAIEEIAGHAAKLSHQMLVYSGRGVFKIRPLDLSRLVEEMIEILKAAVSGNINLYLDLRENLPAVKADATQMRQVLLNLVTNAAEAFDGKSGNISISTRVETIRARGRQVVGDDEMPPPGSCICLEVADNGSGMSPATRARIFDPFFSTKFVGRGLGLASVRGIVHGHGGAIDLESEEGRGSTFRVLLPIAGEALPTPGVKDPAPADWTGAGTILLAEDDKVIRDVGRSMMEHLGFDVIEAKDGYEAIRIYEESGSDIDLVVLDLIMPRLTGREAFSRLLEINPKIRIVLTSGHEEQEATDGISSPNLVGFFKKPYTFSGLATYLRAVMDPGGLDG